MSKWDVLLAIYNFSEVKSLANNAKIRLYGIYMTCHKLQVQVTE